MSRRRRQQVTAHAESKSGLFQNGNLKLIVQLLGFAVACGGAFYELRDLKADVAKIADESSRTATAVVKLNTLIDAKITSADKEHRSYETRLDGIEDRERARRPRP